MAHFARLDDNNVVTQVIVINNEVLLNSKGIEDEKIGIQFCKDTFGGNWIQTSYNATFRGRFAGLGDTYDPINDQFVIGAIASE